MIIWTITQLWSSFTKSTKFTNSIFFQNFVNLWYSYPNRTQVNVLLWRYVQSMSGFLDESIKQEFLELARRRDFVDDVTPADLDCVEFLQAYMPWTVGELGGGVDFQIFGKILLKISFLQPWLWREWRKLHTLKVDIPGKMKFWFEISFLELEI